MRVAVCNNKRRGREAAKKNTKRRINRLKDYMSEAPLKFAYPKSPFVKWIFRQKLTYLHGDRKSRKIKNKPYSFFLWEIEKKNEKVFF